MLEGKTKTGKPKFYCAKKLGENAATRWPPEFEICEDPATAMVTIRKRRPSTIMATEIALLKSLVKHFVKSCPTIVDVNGDSLVVYGADIDVESAAPVRFNPPQSAESRRHSP